MSESPTKTPPPSPSSWALGTASSSSSSSSSSRPVAASTRAALLGTPVGSLQEYLSQPPPRSSLLPAFPWPHALQSSPAPQTDVASTSRGVLERRIARERRVLIGRQDADITLPASLAARVRYITLRLGHRSDSQTIEWLLRQAERISDMPDPPASVLPPARHRSPSP